MHCGSVQIDCRRCLRAKVSSLSVEIQRGDVVFTAYAYEHGAVLHPFGCVVSHTFDCSPCSPRSNVALRWPTEGNSRLTGTAIATRMGVGHAPPKSSVRRFGMATAIDQQHWPLAFLRDPGLMSTNISAPGENCAKSLLFGPLPTGRIPPGPIWALSVVRLFACGIRKTLS